MIKQTRSHYSHLHTHDCIIYMNKIEGSKATPIARIPSGILYCKIRNFTCDKTRTCI